MSRYTVATYLSARDKWEDPRGGTIVHTTRNVWSHCFDAVLSEYPALPPLEVLRWPMSELLWWYDRVRERIHQRLKPTKPQGD